MVELLRQDLVLKQSRISLKKPFVSFVAVLVVPAQQIEILRHHCGSSELLCRYAMI
jgi:hypothetical protein